MQEDRAMCAWGKGACSLCQIFVRCSGKPDWEGKTLFSLLPLQFSQRNQELPWGCQRTKQAVMVKVRPVAGSVII